MTVSIWEPEVTTDRPIEASSDDFVDLFTSQYPKLVGALRVAGAVDRAAAEDIAQEAFARTLGPEFEAEPQLSFETNTGTQRQEFRVAGTLFKVEVFRLSEDAHDQERCRTPRYT